MIVIVYGHGGSGPGHWQRWLERELRGRGVPHQALAGHGHINVDSGYGPWPFALEWLARVGALAGR